MTGCGTGQPAQSSAPTITAGEHNHAKPENAKEQAGPTARLLLTTSQGLLTLDAKTLKPVGDPLSLDGFIRVNPAGDGRHVLISTEKGFEAFDAGSWEFPHGDHSHFYTMPPKLTGTVFPADHPGHVVTHGKTALFADGTGEVTVFDPAELGGKEEPKTEKHRTPEPHHGVAVALKNGNLLTTRSNGKDRVGITVLDKIGDGAKEIAHAANCPGTHGEAVAQGEAVVVGCTDGALVYQDGKIHKVQAPDAYGRIGNQAGSDKSPVVLGDYKVDKTAKLERPSKISLIDTRTATLKHVDLGASYSFHSLGRGPAGEALVLGTDGSLHVIDPESGSVRNKIPVIPAWTEPEAWQETRPALFVDGATAYVTEPSQQKIHAVDLASGAVLNTGNLPSIPNELTGTSGKFYS
ncbi:putative secreted protein [Renibacterium salmoninarum ATCC 33209]|uniref:Putative secreted protein n=1 Tax=Renibacterium salmoninarum (strain ATCC 33209 / DSM 20767 / JCM 11484 / NBRC 15589 / NCIMB 2235) TaxID=288705 RepID=A9WUR4_RENSM|nr:zinc metallochaperone AztD [Renibacterium salmoninarum]ABY24935.1 putative secreted protein [Renibacterium salmoninarum ATCC 33209]